VDLPCRKMGSSDGSVVADRRSMDSGRAGDSSTGHLMTVPKVCLRQSAASRRTVALFGSRTLAAAESSMFGVYSPYGVHECPKPL
jgi:hypothetical protein